MLEPPRHRRHILKGKLRNVLQGLSWLHIGRVECLYPYEVCRKYLQQTTRESTRRINENRLTRMTKHSIKQVIKPWKKLQSM